VVEANDGLRTSFVWMDRESPRQRVEEGVAPEWHEEDWDGLPPEAAGGRLDAYLAADRARGFDPVRAPLLRFALFHTGGGAYRFVISFHHLILDGWSLALVLRDVFATYGALVEGAAPRVPPRPSARPYLEWLGSQDEGAAVGFWREALAGFDAPTPVEGVPAGAPPTGPATPDDFADAVLHLPPDTSRALEGAARELRVTVNTILQGAWGLVLGSHSGESDVVFGATVAGRPPEVAGVDRMLGVFINTLPVRVRVEGERRVGEWLRDLQLRQAQARQFESTPLRTIQASSPVPAGQPLFHTLLVYENFPVEEELRDPELHGPLRFGKTRAIERPNYPLNLVVRSARQVEVKAVYDARRLDAAVVQGLLQRFARVLEQVASGEDRRLRELELLAPGERELLLSEWSGAGTPIPARRCIHEMIREQALRTPHAVAVEGETEALTYAELEERANRLAHLLRARGVGLETRVGILLERTPAIIVACIAVFKAGGAYVPLDPEYPRERLAFMLGDSGAALLLTQSSLADRVAPGCAVLRLDEEGPALAAQPATPPASGATPDHLAYVIYTSGSTGTPKGVGVPHRGGASLLVSVAGTFPASALRGVLAASSVCFDVTIFELFAALISGGSVIVAPNVLALPGLYAADRVTLLCAVPAAARELLRSGSLPRSLEVMALGGEALPADLAREVVAIPGGPALYNCYGPTEDSVYSALALVEGAPAGDPPIGRPLPGGRTYVLDAAMGPLPAGAWGELFLGGAGLARGYLGRPSLTADRFVPDPYAAEPGARLYRTGDRARWSADGVLEYGGRLDRQVKIRGFRIEPGEIEVALRDHPRVLDAAVVPHGDGDRRRLVGYVVSPDGVTPDELRAHLRDRVPAFMVPPVFVTLDAMPLNPNGKVDRGRLPSPDEAANAGGHVAPRTPVEEALAAVWCQVLGRDQVGVEDNFFEIGGDSILAIQVVARAARAGLSLSARQLFEHNTVAALASVAGVIESSSAAPDEAAEGDWAPLLPIQGWFFEQEMARPGHFNQAFALELPAGLPAGHWRALVDELVRVHPGLRLRFGRDETGAWRQRADPHAGFAWDEAELEGLDADAQRAGLREHAARLQAALDPEAGPLFGAVLGRRGAESDWLVLVAHHLGVDGVSWRVLVDDLARAHAALLHGPAVAT
jgi:amino acid adenylation domain-containing protein